MTMQIDNLQYANITNKKKQNIIVKNSKDIRVANDTFEREPKTLQNMLLEEIRTFLHQNSINDILDIRANDLVKLQKFAEKVDTATYRKMTNILLGEQTVAQASMRYETFPTEEMLVDNPTLFNELLKTTLAIKDTVQSLMLVGFKQRLLEVSKKTK